MPLAAAIPHTGSDMEFKPAKCPNCAGSLQVPASHTTVNCMFCGSTIVVREAIHAAAVAGVANWSKLAAVAAKAGNFAEAYSYQSKILEVDPQNHEAWFGKGEAAGWMASPKEPRIAEMLALFQSAVEHSPEEIRPRMIARTNSAIAVIALNAYRRACKYVASLPATDGVRVGHGSTCWYLVGLMEQAHKVAPEDSHILEGIVWVCNDILTARYYPVPKGNQHRSWVDWEVLPMTSDYRKGIKQRIDYYSYLLKQVKPKL